MSPVLGLASVMCFLVAVLTNCMFAFCILFHWDMDTKQLHSHHLVYVPTLILSWLNPELLALLPFIIPLSETSFCFNFGGTTLFELSGTVSPATKFPGNLL